MKQKMFFSLLLASVLMSCVQEDSSQKETIFSDTLQIDPMRNTLEHMPPRPYVSIDTARLGEKYDKEICFSRYASAYPKIKGPGDWTAINKIIKDTIDRFIEKAQSNTECLNEKGAPICMGWATTDFEVFNNDSNCICIYLDLMCGFGGGNMWIPSARILVIDSKSKAIIPSETFIKKVNRKEVNQRIYDFFKEGNSSDADEFIGRHYVKTDQALKKFEYGIRNDSLIIAFPECLSSHASYMVYTVPVKLLK